MLDFRLMARDLAYQQCTHCDVEVGADEPVLITDIDGDEGRAHATIAHVWCESAVRQGQAQGMRHAANVAAALGADAAVVFAIRAEAQKPVADLLAAVPAALHRRCGLVGVAA